MRIGIIGTGWSGSSALVEFLNKTQKIQQYPGEFKVIGDPKGILDFHRNVSKQYTPYNISYHLMEFSKRIDSISKRQSPFNPLGLGDKKVLKLKEIIFRNFGVITTNFNQRSVFRTENPLGNLLIKIQKKRNQNTDFWCKKHNSAIATGILRNSLNEWLKQEYSFKEDDLILFDQPCFIDQTELTSSILSLDYIYVVYRKSEMTKTDMIKNEAMIGKIKDKDIQEIIFQDFFKEIKNSLSSLNHTRIVRLIEFEKLAYYTVEDFEELMPFLDKNVIKKAYEAFNWDYTRKNVEHS